MAFAPPSAMPPIFDLDILPSVGALAHTHTHAHSSSTPKSHSDAVALIVALFNKLPLDFVAQQTAARVQ